MRFVNGEIGLDFELSDQHMNIIVLEDNECYSKMIFDMWKMQNGDDGPIIISQREKMLKFSKDVDLIVNPFALSCNDKKIINRIIQDLSSIAKEKYMEITAELNGKIVEFLDGLIQELPYPITYNLDLDVSELLKCYKIKMDDDVDDYLEEMISYIRLIAQIIGKKVFVFVGLKQYLSNKQLKLFYEAARYEHIIPIDIENFCSQNRIKGEKYVIIDKDKCIIIPE